MTILDYITITVFAVGILIAGVSFSGSGKNMKSFFAAGGAVPWWISGLSLFMGFFSAGTFVVWGSIAYSEGIIAIMIQMCMCIAGFFVGAFIAPRWKKTKVLTAAEYIASRLGFKVQKMYMYLFLLISIFTTGSFLYPVAKIVEVSSGLSLQTCILLLGGFSVLYVAIGGLWAVVVTDVLQFVILTAAVIIVIPLSFQKVGGVDSFITEAPDELFSFLSSEYTPLFLVAFCIYNLFFLGGNWGYVQRYTSVNTTKDAKKVGYLFGCLYLVSPFLWMLPPMIYRVFNPELGGLDNEGAYLLMCKEALPQGLLGLMIGGMVFATASSLNGALNISAGVFTNDIYKRFFPNASDSQLMRTARISTFGFGVLAIVVASLIPLMGGIVNVVISIAALTGVPIYLPIIWTLFSNRQNSFSVTTTTIVSLLVNAFFKFISPWLLNFSLSRTMEMIIGVTIPLALLLMFELYYKLIQYKDPKAITYKQKEEDSNELPIEESSTDNSLSTRIIGGGITLAGLVITILGVCANGLALIVVSSVGILLVLTGGFIYLNNKKNKEII